MKMEQGAGAPKKPQKKGGINPALIAIIAVVVVGLGVGGFFLFKNLGADAPAGTSSDPTSSDVSSDTSSGDEGDVSSAVFGEDEEEPLNAELGILDKFTEQYNRNNDFIGRVYVPNTLLDSEVVQGDDNEFYLNNDMDKKYFAWGVPFLDYRALFLTDYQSDILTLYGHNSKNGDYFESVKDYQKIDYYKANPIIHFDTIYGNGTYKIIGRFTEYVAGDFFHYHDHFNLNHPSDPQEERFNNYLKELDKINLYETDIDVKFGDQLLVLSTCNDEIQGPKDTPYRDVLVARKVRPGEDPTVNVDNIKPNLDVVMPDGWVKKYGKANPYK